MMWNTKYGIMRYAVCCLLVSSMTLAPVLSRAAESFDDLRRNISVGLETRTEREIGAFLKAGLAEQEVNRAHASAGAWFAQNTAKEPETLLLAARVAEQSGAYPEAIAFYQQFVARTDPKRVESQEAVMRLYHLMIDVMSNQENSAYMYMIRHAERFMPYGSARQVNTWLLEEAWKGYEATGDMQEYVTLVTLIYRAGYSNLDLKAIYEEYLGRLLRPNRTVTGNPSRDSDIQVGQAYVDLAKVIPDDEQLRLSLAWLGEVWRYNAMLRTALEHNNDKAATPTQIPAPPLAAADALLSKYPDAGYLVWSELYHDRDSAKKWLMTEGGGRDAKVALMKKYLKNMSPIIRFKVLQTLMDYDPSLVDEKQKEILKSNLPRRLEGFTLMGANTPEAERLNEFRKLLPDFDSAAPKAPYVDDRLVAIADVTVNVWPELMKSSERQWILIRALEEARDRNSTDWLQYMVHPAVPDGPHKDEGELRGLVQAYAEKGEIIPWLTQAWINSVKPQWGQKPSDPATVAVMEKLRSLPGYSKLSPVLRESARHAFRITSPEVDAFRNRSSQDTVFAELLALTEEADAAALTAACEAALPRLEAAPERVSLDHDRLNGIPPAALEDTHALTLLLGILDNPSTTRWYRRGLGLYDRIIQRLKESPDPRLIQQHAFLLWTAQAHRVYLRKTAEQIPPWMAELVEKHPGAAATLAQSGLYLVSRNEYLEEIGIRQTCSEVLSKANVSLGIRSIAVDETDPAYPVYKSQSEFVTGNEDAAWELFDANREQAVSMHRKLSAKYWLWVLEKLIFQRDEAGQQRVVTLLRDWRADSATAFSRGQAAMLDILYGDIARRQGGRGQDNALKIYRKTAENPEYAGAAEVYTALLRCIEVQRTMKDLAGALETADELIKMRIPEIWATAHYAKAEVYYDMENYDEVRSLLDDILAREPNHKDAKILQGKVQIEQKSLMDATEVDIVSEAVAQKAISPGEWLTVRLTDPTLAVAGGGVDIEVDVWTTSEDRETVLLAQFGDSKTKFLGRVRIRLGNPIPGDGVLQVIGDDKVYYAYSKRFMDKVKMKDPGQGGPLTIVSDATLMASANKLLSAKEQKEADVAALMRRLMDKGAVEGMSEEAIEEEAQRRLAASVVEGRADLGEELDRRDFIRQTQDLVKPGNPIYIRVEDADRSLTAGVDQLVLSAETSSGDIVRKVILNETDTHSGIFEGTLASSDAQATAFATSSRPGANPNTVISPKATAPWRAASLQTKGTDVLSVDLNDNVPLEKLTITASEPGFGLKRFRVLAGTQREELEPVAFWPSRPMPAPLAPSILLAEQPEERQSRKVGLRNWINHGNTPKTAYDLQAISSYLTKDYLLHGQWHQQALTGPSDALSKDVLSPLSWATGGRFPPNLACRFRAFFCEEEAVERGIAVFLENGSSDKDKKEGVSTLPGGGQMPVYVTVNDKMLTWDGKVFRGEFSLLPGLQKIEIFFQGSANSINFGRACKVFLREPESGKWTEAPAGRFDPSTFPDAIRGSVVAPARIEESKPGTEWTVRFSQGSRARILALEFLDYEGPEASLNKLALTAGGGKKVLPVAVDYSDALKNDVLEIVSGDTIWIRYVDERFVNESRERQERVLYAGYCNASIAFAEIKKKELLLFRHGDRLPLLVEDRDMDVSEGSDTVKVTLSTRSGSKTTVDLVESSSGLFAGWIQLDKSSDGAPGGLRTVDGDTITMTYWDEDNESPGVAVERKAEIGHAVYREPSMALSDMRVEPAAKGKGAGTASVPDAEDSRDAFGDDRLQVVMKPIQITRDFTNTLTFVSGVYNYMDIIAPHLMLHPDSELRLFVQTETARRRAKEIQAAASTPAPGAAAGAPVERPVFDVTVPGTRLLTAEPVLRAYGNYSTAWELRLEKPALGLYEIQQPNVFDTYWQKSGSRSVFRALMGSWPGPEESPGTTVDAGLLLRYATAGTSHPLSEQELATLLQQLGYNERRGPNDNPELEMPRCKMREQPIVKPGELVHIGFCYEDNEGRTHWLTASARTVTHGQFSAVAERTITGFESRKGDKLTLGDRIRVNVRDLGFDTTEERDSVELQVSADSGAAWPLVLNESAAHSAEFSGSFELVMDIGEAMTNRNIAIFGFPAAYDDTVRVTFTDSGGRQLTSENFRLKKGSDGRIQPFAKQYGDEDMAIRTLFAMAEAYLESAKNYKQAKQLTEARLNYETAKQLLSSTLDRFTDPQALARAEYLLGDLSYEEAGNTEEPELRKQSYYAALARFSKVTANYSDTEHAAKAQFKKAVTYERLNEPESAAQEYVKLAYMYPDSEFLAVAMYRLGTHFRSKALEAQRELAGLQEQMKGKERKDVDREVLFKIDQLAEEMKKEYTKAGKIFGRIVERFPTHELAGQGGLRSAQCFYASGDFKAALAPLLAVADGENYDGVLRAEALYWAGKSYQELNDRLTAYAMFVRCTEDYPETEWSGYSLAELALPEFEKVAKEISRGAKE